MYPFLDTQLNTLLGLINQSNPGLQVRLTSAMLQTLVPTAVTPGSGQIQDTSLRLQTLQGNTGHYYGYQTVFYRRINLANLFRSMTLTLDNYVGSTTMTAAQFVAAFNAKYGTELLATDFTNTSFSSGTSASVTMVANCLCYTGTFTVKWTQGVPQISQVITSPVLAGKLYPGGNTFGSGRKPQADVLTYGLDCSGAKGSLLALAASTTITPAQWAQAGSAPATILAFLQHNFPSLNFNSADSATPGGLGNLVVSRYTLPSTSAPGANSAKYTGAATITAAAGSWFQGKFYMHFN